MTGLVRKASLLVVLGLVLTAAAASAGIPDPTNSICPNLVSGNYWVTIVACKSGVVDPYGAFTVTVKDAAGNPVPGCDVKLCTSCSDIKLSQTAGVTCGTPQCVTTVSDVNGVASFDISGASNQTNGKGAGCGLNGATIYACNVQLCTVSMAVLDQNGAALTPGLEITDVSAWMGCFATTPPYRARCDINRNASVEITDLSLLIKLFGLGNSVSRCAVYCP
jgi:hypothetical protein